MMKNYQVSFTYNKTKEKSGRDHVKKIMGDALFPLHFYNNVKNYTNQYNKDNKSQEFRF